MPDFLAQRIQYYHKTISFCFVVQTIIALLRFTNWDADLFNTFSIPLVELSKELNPFNRAALLEGLQRIWRGYFHTEANTDIIAEIGRLYIILGEFALAAEKYEAFNLIRLNSSVGLNNVAVCYLHLDRKEEAKALFERALEIKPDFEDPKYWLSTLQPAAVQEEGQEQGESDSVASEL